MITAITFITISPCCVLLSCGETVNEFQVASVGSELLHVERHALREQDRFWSGKAAMILQKALFNGELLVA